MKKRRIETWKRDTPDQPVVEVPQWRFGLTFFPERVEGDLRGGNLMQRIGEKRPGTTPKVTQYFLHNGLRYVSMGSGSCCWGASTDAYELVEVTPEVIPPPRQKYDYSGELVSLDGRKHVLCRPVKFRSIPFTAEEGRWLLRHQWAFGGYFAAIHKTYESFVRHDLDDYQPGTTYGELHSRVAPAIVAACRLELKALAKLPKGREAMAKFCRTDPLFLAKPWKNRAPLKSGPKTRPKMSTDINDLLAALLEKK